MNRFAALGCLAAAALALAACATPATTATDWNRPFQPIDTPPVFQHDMAIANPPFPRPIYGSSSEEPTRFEFHPRNIVYDDEQQQNGGNQGAAQQGGGMDNGGGGDAGE